MGEGIDRLQAGLRTMKATFYLSGECPYRSRYMRFLTSAGASLSSSPGSLGPSTRSGRRCFRQVALTPLELDSLPAVSGLMPSRRPQQHSEASIDASRVGRCPENGEGQKFIQHQSAHSRVVSSRCDRVSPPSPYSGRRGARLTPRKRLDSRARCQAKGPDPFRTRPTTNAKSTFGGLAPGATISLLRLI